MTCSCAVCPIAERLGIFVNQQSKPLGVVINETITAKRLANRRPRYISNLRRYLTAFARQREQVPIASIKAEDIECWLTGRGEKPITRKANLCRLSVLFSYAVRRGYIQRNPCATVERVSIEWKAPEILTIAECKQLLSTMRAQRPAYVPYLVLCLLGGIRPEECIRLDWPNIDLDRGVVVIDSAASKVRERRIVDLPSNAVAWLRLGGRIKMSRITKGKIVGISRTILGRKKWPQDVLRHTAASMMLARDKDAQRVALQLGNSPDILFRHYRELVSEEQATEFFSIYP